MNVTFEQVERIYSNTSYSLARMTEELKKTAHSQMLKTGSRSSSLTRAVNGLIDISSKYENFSSDPKIYNISQQAMMLYGHTSECIQHFGSHSPVSADVGILLQNSQKELLALFK